MRKIFPIIAVFAILVSCAVPAFAIGNQLDSSVRYSALPFDYWSISGGGNVYYSDYPFKACSVKSSINEVELNAFSQDTIIRWQPSAGTSESYTYSAITGHVECPYGTQIHGEVNYEFRGAGNAQWQTITLVGSDMVVPFNIPLDTAHNGASFLFRPPTDGSAPPNFVKVRFYGEYYVPFRTDDGTTHFEAVPFDVFTNISDRGLNLYQELYEVMRELPSFHYIMYFKTLNVDMVCNNLGQNPDVGLYYNESTVWQFNTEPYDFSVYYRNAHISGDPPSGDTIIETNFELGSFLTETVGGFLSIPIFGGFSFGHLLGVVFGLLFVLWFIKLIK